MCALVLQKDLEYWQIDELILGKFSKFSGRGGTMVEHQTTNLEIRGSNPGVTQHLEKMTERKKFYPRAQCNGRGSAVNRMLDGSTYPG